MAETPSRPSRPLPPSVTEDVQVRPIFAFGGGLVLLGAVTLLLMGWLLPVLTARHSSACHALGIALRACASAAGAPLTGRARAGAAAGACGCRGDLAELWLGQ